MAKAPKKCPMCSAKNEWKLVDKSKKGFSGGKAVVGAVVFGPIGILGGTFGKKYQTFICAKCKFQHEYKK